MKWISVDEEKPNYETKVIFWHNGDSKFAKLYSRGSMLRDFWDIEDFPCKNIVMNDVWMPLPEPPKED